MYCSGSVDEHETCLSHHLTVDSVTRDQDDGARLALASVTERAPKISYQTIQTAVDEENLSESMGYCGQEGFNFTQIEPRDLAYVEENTTPVAESPPAESLQAVAEEYFGGDE